MKIIAISGCSGSGKSTLAVALQKHLRQAGTACEIVCEDRYYRPLTAEQHAHVSSVDFDHPDSLDNPLMTEQMQTLLSGQAIDIPNYSYETHTRSDNTTRLSPPQVLIVEGLHLLHRESLMNLYDAMLYVDAPIEVCLERRIKRDINERGRTRESVIEQFNKTVRPNFAEYIYPSKINADYVIDGTIAIEETIHQLLDSPLFPMLSD